MTFEQIKSYCLSKLGATEDFPFGPEPMVIKVGTKMFALLNIKNGKVSISLKCDPFIAQSLRQQYSAVTPGYHLNKQHWNSIEIDGTVPDEQLIWMFEHSYELVYKGLTKKEKQAILIK